MYIEYSIYNEFKFLKFIDLNKILKKQFFNVYMTKCINLFIYRIYLLFAVLG